MFQRNVISLKIKSFRLVKSEFRIKENPCIHILKLSKARWFLILAVLSFEYTAQEVCSAALSLSHGALERR